MTNLEQIIGQDLNSLFEPGKSALEISAKMMEIDHKLYEHGIKWRDARLLQLMQEVKLLKFKLQIEEEQVKYWKDLLWKREEEKLNVK